MIPESEVEKAVDYLRDSAVEAAQARANMKYLAEFLKTKKAQIANALKGSSSVAAAESAALADPAYIEILDGYRVAVEMDARFSFLREAAQAKIEAWRTQSSNQRSGV